VSAGDANFCELLAKRLAEPHEVTPSRNTFGAGTSAGWPPWAGDQPPCVGEDGRESDAKATPPVASPPQSFTGAEEMVKAGHLGDMRREPRILAEELGEELGESGESCARAGDAEFCELLAGRLAEPLEVTPRRAFCGAQQLEPEEENAEGATTLINEALASPQCPRAAALSSSPPAEREQAHAQAWGGASTTLADSPCLLEEDNLRRDTNIAAASAATRDEEEATLQTLGGQSGSCRDHAAPENETAKKERGEAPRQECGAASPFSWLRRGVAAEAVSAATSSTGSAAACGAESHVKAGHGPTVSRSGHFSDIMAAWRSRERACAR